MERGGAPKVIAHRGASAQRPENTFPAYELAVAQGADMIEIDLHRARDGEVVVTHDWNLDRLGGRGGIADHTLAQIRDLDAGGGEAVPRLDEVLDRFGSRVAFNLELKRARRADYPGLEASCLEAVGRRGLLDSTLFSSFFESILRRLRALSAAARIGVLCSKPFPGRAIRLARELGAETLHPAARWVNGRLVARAHGAGLAVYPFTVDDPGQMRRMLELGVDGLFTNEPSLLRRVIDSQGAAERRFSR